MVVINVLIIATGERFDWEIEQFFERSQNRLWAKLKNSQFIAELDLEHPERGWAVYPN